MNEISFSSALFVIRGKDRGRRFELSSRTTSIGRLGSNDVQLFDGKASRHHAEIQFEGSRHKIVDLGSSNGTTVNDERVDVCLLSSGDKIKIGNTLLLFTEGLSIRSDTNAENVRITDDADSNQQNVVHSVNAHDAPNFSDMISGDSAIGINQAHENLRILYGASLENSMTLDIDEILQRILDLVFKMVDAQYGCIMLIDEEDEFEIKAQSQKFRGTGSAIDHYEIPRVILQRALAENRGILANRHIEIDGGVEQRQVICTPMYGRYGRVGLIYIEGTFDVAASENVLESSDSACFSEEHLKLTITIGHQAGLAIEDKIFSAAVIHSERMAAIGETVALMSHQIKNIMQGIGGGGYMIKHGIADKDNETVIQGWKIVEKNQQRISDLILDMLSYSKDRKPDLKSNDLIEIVNDVVQSSASYAADNEVNLICELPPEKILFVDSDMVYRAIHNVVLNAIDACSESDQPRNVEIRCVDSVEFCEIKICDNGVGIEPGMLPKIFSPFKSTKGGRGTGLGLTIARKNCREHGGEIVVASIPGRGTMFRIMLPHFNSASPQLDKGPPSDELTVTRIQDIQSKGS